MSYSLRALDSEADALLLHEVYSWQAGKRLERLIVSALPFTLEEFEEEFSRKNGRVVMGLLNGTLQAAYFVKEQERGQFEVHLAVRRGADVEALKAGAIQIRDWLFQNGAREIYGQVLRRNFPLRRFVRQIGFYYSGISIFQGTSTGEVAEWMRYVAS